MVSKRPFEPNKITVALEGLMVLFTNKSSECMIDLLRDAPAHNLSIVILEKESEGGEFKEKDRFINREAEGSFDLDVQNNPNPGIRKRDESKIIDRFKDSDSKCFNWLIDFEKDFFTPPIGARRDGFISFIKVNDGEIFTQLVSENHLQYRRANSDQWVHFGRVAVEMGIEIKLDTPQSRAVFTKIGGRSCELVRGKEYIIRIERKDTTAPVTGSDAELYFKAIGSLLGPEQPMYFRSFPPLVQANAEPPNTPDATCPQGRLSKTGAP